MRTERAGESASCVQNKGLLPCTRGSRFMDEALDREIVEAVRRFVRSRSDSDRQRTRTQRRVSARAGRPDEGARPLWRDYPAGARRPRAQFCHLRPDHVRAVARLDESCGRDQQPSDYGLCDRESRHRRAETALSARDGGGRQARRARAHRAARRQRRSVHPHDGHSPRRQLRRERQQDVHHQRPPRHDARRGRQDRSQGEARVRGYQPLRGREERARPDRQPPAQETRLQGDRHL